MLTQVKLAQRIVPYIVNSEFLLWLQQEDALVDGPDGAHGAWVSLQTERGLLRWKLLERGELQRHLHRRHQGRESEDVRSQVQN